MSISKTKTFPVCQVNAIDQSLQDKMDGIETPESGKIHEMRKSFLAELDKLAHCDFQSRNQCTAEILLMLMDELEYGSGDGKFYSFLHQVIDTLECIENGEDLASVKDSLQNIFEQTSDAPAEKKKVMAYKKSIRRTLAMTLAVVLANIPISGPAPKARTSAPSKPKRIERTEVRDVSKTFAAELSSRAMYYEHMVDGDNPVSTAARFIYAVNDFVKSVKSYGKNDYKRLPVDKGGYLDCKAIVINGKEYDFDVPGNIAYAVYAKSIGFPDEIIITAGAGYQVYEDFKRGMRYALRRAGAEGKKVTLRSLLQAGSDNLQWENMDTLLEEARDQKSTLIGVLLYNRYGNKITPERLADVTEEVNNNWSDEDFKSHEYILRKWKKHFGGDKDDQASK